MPTALDEDLASVEKCCRLIGAAVDARDFEAAGLANQRLTAALDAIGQRLCDEGRSLSGETVRSVISRLTRVFEDHERLTTAIRDARDAAGGELDATQAGHRVAAHYLDTAGS